MILLHYSTPPTLHCIHISVHPHPPSLKLPFPLSISIGLLCTSSIYFLCAMCTCQCSGCIAVKWIFVEIVLSTQSQFKKGRPLPSRPSIFLCPLHTTKHTFRYFHSRFPAYQAYIRHFNELTVFCMSMNVQIIDWYTHCNSNIFHINNKLVKFFNKSCIALVKYFYECVWYVNVEYEMLAYVRNCVCVFLSITLFVHWPWFSMQ